MYVRPVVAASVAFGAAVFAGSCAGGPKHVSEITPAVIHQLSGAWVLNESESDDPDQAMRAGEPGRGAGGRGGSRPPEGGGPPGGGGLTGRPGMGGGGMGGGRPGMGGRRGGAPLGRANRAAMEEVRRMATVPPRRLELSVSDSAVVVSYPREEPWLLPFGSDVKREAADSVEVAARADWENGRLVVSRRVSGGGSVTETFMPSVDGKRLTVDVEVAMGSGRGGTEFQRVYEPEGATRGGPPR